MFGNSTDFAQPEPRPLGLDADRLPSNEIGRPVAYFAGICQLGLTYLGQPFNVVAEPVYQDAKKASVQTGFNYSFSFVGLLAHGVLDRVYEVRIDKRVAWAGDMGFSGESIDITVEGRGVLRIYKGSETQTEDAHAAEAFAQVGDVHTAYRGLAYCVAIEWVIGYNTNAVPEIQILASRHPGFEWMTSDPNVQSDCNPVAIMADLVTNPLAGLGADVSRLNTDELDDVATTLRDECVGLSPLIKTQASFRELCARFNEQFDGFLKPSAEGKFSLGLARAVSGSLPTFDETCLLDAPEIDPGDWDDTLNQVNVTYTNRDFEWVKDSEPGFSSGNFAVTAQLKQQTFERLDITRQRYAAVLAAVIAARKGLPLPTGRLKVRRSKLQGLELGGVFKLSWGKYGICNWQLRCTSIARPNSRSPFVEIRFEEDRGAFNARYFTPAVQVHPDPVEYDAEPIAHQAVLELPYLPEFGSRANRFALLAARPNAQTIRFAAHRLKAGGSYEKVGDFAAFAYYGTLHADYPATTTIIDTELGLTVTLAGADTSLANQSVVGLPLEDALAGDWLLWINDGAIGGGVGNEVTDTVAGEILSVFDASLVSAGRYKFKAIRNRFDTQRMAHLAGAPCWLLRRSELSKMIFAPAFIGASETFKLQPATGADILDLADATAITTAVWQRGARTSSPINLRGNGSSTPTLSASNDLVVTWDNTSDERAPGFTEHFSPLPTTILKIGIAATGAHVLTVNVNPGVNTYTFTWAALTAALGGSVTDFRVLAWHSLKGPFSMQHARLDVNVV